MKKNKNNKKVKDEKVVFYSKEMKNKKSSNDDYNRVIKLIIILVIMAVLIGGLFYLNGRFVTKDYFQETTTTTTAAVEYDSSVITVDSIFDIKDSNYYVLLYDGSVQSATIYTSLITSYTSEDISLYSVDLSNAMNKKYYDVKGTANEKPKKASDIVITKATLMQIKKGKVVKYITDVKEITKILSASE